MKAFCPRRPTVRTLRAAHARARVGSDRQAWGAKLIRTSFQCPASDSVASSGWILEAGALSARGLCPAPWPWSWRAEPRRPWQAGASASTPWGFQEVSRLAEAPVRGSDRPQPCETSGQPRASGEDRQAELLSPGVLAAGQTHVPTMEPGAQPMA